jgi:hypothetical protein
MMKIITLLAVLAISLSTSAHAALQKGDWLATGDKKVAIDTDTGLEWLTLDNTKGKSINDVISQLGAGGAYAGWRLPTESEVFALTNKMYGSTVGQNDQDTSYQGNIVWAWRGDSRQVAMMNYINMLGLTNYVQGYDQYGINYTYTSYGLYLNGNPGVGTQPSQVLFSGVYTFRSIHSRDHFYAYSGMTHPSYSTADVKYSHVGVYLVSDGGLTLSSKLDPSVNINNPNAPINQVSTPAISGALLLLLLFFRRSIQGQRQNGSLSSV